MTATERRPVVLRIVAVLLVLAAVGFGMSWLQMNRTLERGRAMEQSLGATVVTLNGYLSEFRGETAAAADLIPKLAEGEAELAALRDEIERLPLPLIPGPSGRGAGYRDALESYTHDVAGYYAHLSSVATVVVDRGDIVERLAGGFGVLDDLAQPDVSVDDVTRVMADIRRTVDATIAALESLDTTTTGVYSSEPLRARLASILTIIAAIDESLASEDAESFRQSTAAFGQVLQADWQALFFAADEAGIQQLATRIETLTESRAAVESASTSLAAARRAAGVAAFVLAVIGALTAAVAWLR